MNSVRHILVGTDLSEAGGCAVETAVEIAQRYDARLTAVFVPGDLHLASPRTSGELRASLGKLARAELKRHARAHGARGADLIVTFGPATRGLGDQIRSLEPDLVVVGLCRGGVRRRLLGSVGERLLRFSTHTPLWFTIGRAALDEADATPTVVVGSDATSASDTAVRFGLAEARARGARLEVVYALGQRPGAWERITRRAGHTAQPDQAEALERLHSTLAPLCEGTDVEVVVHAIEGRPHEVIADLARRVHASLIVVGRHGPEPVHDLLVGSTTTRLLHVADGADVLVTPVTKEHPS